MSKIPLFAAGKWIEIYRSEDRRNFNLVARLKGPGNTLAFFKANCHQEPVFQGTLAANERILFELAELLTLPVTPIYFYTHDDIMGHLSIAVPGDAEVWFFAQEYFESRIGPKLRKRINECFIDPESFFGMVVLDVWVANDDRHEKNFMASLLDGESKLRLFLIDHGHCLFGPNHKRGAMLSNPEEWFKMSRFIQSDNLRDLITSFEQLNPWIEKIEAIKDREIDDIVDGIVQKAPQYLSYGEGEKIKELLRTRRDRLRECIFSWCKVHGKVA